MWRVQIVLATLLVGFLPSVFGNPSMDPASTVTAAAPPCNNYSSNVTPPENIGVAITNSAGAIIDVVYIDFKSYVRDVLPNEWLSGWESAAYQAGALAVKTFAWYHTIHWRGGQFLPTDECYHVRDDQGDQVYFSGSRTIPTDFAVEQTWNYLLLNDGAIYPTHHNSGYSYHQCGDVSPPPGLYPGAVMSQYGSQACALEDKRWAQIVDIYYYDNPTYPGEHTYGQWHAAIGWGATPWTPLTVQGQTWKFAWSNSSNPSVTTIAYGAATDMKIVGDWDGNATHTPGVVRVANGHLNWYLRNSRTSGPGEIVFPYGVAGDVPVVGDWDGNGTWTPGVVRGRHWLLRNSNTGGSAQYNYAFGLGGDTPVPGMWLTTVSCSHVDLPMTAAMVRLVGQNLIWHERFYHSSGEADKSFAYGRYTDRPMSGDWRSGDCLIEFGPGVVRDDPPGYPSGLQRWLLHYTNSGGTADLNFPWEAIRP
jgi:hypothetical protein